jgi:hypothetical protein
VNSIKRCSSGRKALEIYFYSSDRHKIQLGWWRLTSVSKCRKTLHTHFLPPWNPKSELDEFAEMMFQVSDWHRDLITWLLNVLKFDFSEVDEAMFQGVDRPCEIITYFLGI